MALLRGINVGGRNIVAMAELRQAFEAAGYNAVTTYIQFGNVLFDSDAPRLSLEDDVEVGRSRRRRPGQTCAYRVPVTAPRPVAADVERS